MTDSILVSIGETRRRRLDAMFESDPYATPYLRPLSDSSRLEELRAIGTFPRSAESEPSVDEPADGHSGASRTPRRARGLEISCPNPATAVPTAFQEVMTVDETARFLRIGAGSVRSLLRNEGMPCIRFGRRTRIRRESVLAWLASKETARGAPKPEESSQV